MKSTLGFIFGILLWVLMSHLLGAFSYLEWDWFYHMLDWSVAGRMWLAIFWTLFGLMWASLFVINV